MSNATIAGSNDGLFTPPSKEAALARFRDVIAPLPDVPPASAPVEPEFDGTGAVTDLLRHWNELSPAQQGEVRRVLRWDQLSTRDDDRPAVASPPGTRRGGTTSGAGTSTGTPGTSAPTTLPPTPSNTARSDGLVRQRGGLSEILAAPGDEFRPIVDEVNGQLAAKFGQPRIANTPLQVITGFVPGVYVAQAIGWVNIDKDPKRAGDGPDTCPIELVEERAKGYVGDPQVMRSIFAHELTHCYQFRQLGSFAAYQSTGNWLLEGEATWTMEQLHPTGGRLDRTVKHWNTYHLTPASELFDRSYDAVGFYGHVGDNLPDQEAMWPRILPALGQGEQGAFETLTAGVQGQTLDSWGPSYYRETKREWDMLGPGPVPARSGRPIPKNTAPVSNGADIDLGPVSRWQVETFAVPATADIVVVKRSYGWGRAGDTPLGVDQAITNGPLRLCFKPGGCQCPPGTTGNPPQATTASGPLLKAGLTGGPSGAFATAQGFSLDEYCKRPDRPRKTPAPLPPGGGGGGSGFPASQCRHNCGGSNGDPHLYTFDGLRYDLQTVGEHILVRSTTDDLTVQARQEPLTGSRLVSINTAIAVGVDGHRITVTGNRGEQSVRIDGRTIDTFPANAGGTRVDAKLSSYGQVTDIVLADQTVVQVLPVGTSGLHPVIDLADGRRGRIEGLLGNADDDPANDLRTPRGEEIPGGDRPDADAVHRTLGPSWQVDRETTRFDYADGRSPDSYLDPSFPDKIIGLGDVPNREAAEATCRAAGITAPGRLEACIVDVGMTGDDSFAAGFAAEERIDAPTQKRERKRSTLVFEGTVRRADEQPDFRFDGRKDEIVDIGYEGCEDNGIAFELRSPDEKAVAIQTGCRMGRVVLPEDASYRLVANSLAERTGNFRIPIRPVRPDVVRDARPGDVLEGRIDQRAAHDVWRLDVRSGDRIQLGPDDCDDGGLAIAYKRPNGSDATVTSGCGGEPITVDRDGVWLLTVNVVDGGRDTSYRMPLRRV